MRTKQLLFPILILSTMTATQGASNTWTNASADFLWNATSTNWTGPATWTNGDDAVFGPTGVGSITLSSGITANSLTFGNTGYNIGGAPLTLSGPGISTATGVDASISSIIQGNAGLTKTGTGNLRLTGANAYTGTTSITGGALSASNASGPSIPGNVSLGGAGTSVFLNTTSANQFASGSVVSFSNGGSDAKFQLRGNNQTIGGLSSGTGNTLSIVQNDEAGTPGYISAPGAATLTIDNATDQSFYGIIRTSTGGALSLIKEGTGTQELRNSTFAVGISYNGTTAINNGKLTLNLSGANNGFSSAVTVNSGGTLGLDGTFNMNQVIAGAGAVEKLGTATVTMTGATANTYNGLTSVNGGTLVLGKTAGITSVAGNINIGNASGDDVLRLGASNQIADTSVLTFNSQNVGGNGGKLEIWNFNETVGGLVSSGGTSLIQTFESGGSGTGTLTVDSSQNQTFDGIIRNNGGLGGTTAVFALTKAGTGTLTILNTTAVAGNSYTGLTTVAGGTLQFGNSTATRKGLGSGGLQVDAGASALLWYSNVQSHGNTFSGAGNLEFRSGSSSASRGNNEHIITGTSANYSGAITVSDTRLRLQSATSALGNASATNTITMTGAGQLMYNVAGTFNYNIKISGFGYWENLSEGVDTLGALRIEAGAIQAGKVTLAGNAAIGAHQAGGTISGVIGDNGSNFGFTKLGNGKLTLTGTNTYTGETVVQSGTLALTGSGSIGASTTIEVKSGAFLDVSGVTGGWSLGSAQTLEGAGTITGDITVGGTLATGTSPGTLNVAGNTTLAAGSAWEVELGGTAVTQFDRLLTTGTLAAGGLIELSLINGFAPVAGDQFQIAGFTGFTDNSYSFDVTGAALGSGLSWDFSSFESSGIVAVIPETSSLLLAGIGALGLLRRRR